MSPIEVTCAILKKGSSLLGIELNPEQLEKFTVYYKELTEQSKHINLTTIIEWESVQSLHFLDSISVYRALTKQILQSGKVLDIGTGAGFPGIPLKIAFPNIQLHLIESIGKKTNFLKNLITKLDLDNVKIHLGRAEQLAHIKDLRENFDCVLTRAVAKLNTLAELTLPFCRIGGVSVAQKQLHINSETEQASYAFDILGGNLESQIKISLDNLLYPRSLVVIRKKFNTPSKYPRRPGIPSKRPL